MEPNYVDQLARIEGATTDELARIDRAYREIQRRDGAALWHAMQWRRLALVLVVVVLAYTGVLIPLMLYKSQVQAFVQVVQMTEEGRLVQVGIPMNLLAYAPQDTEYMDMLAQWVTKRRWRGDDESMKRTRNEWSWLFRHSCGLASEQLKKDEVREAPFTASKARASVEIKAITKTETPASYQVTWREVTLDRQGTTLKEQEIIGTFTVGRVKPKTLTDAMDNRLGLCVTGYGFAPKGGT